MQRGRRACEFRSLVSAFWQLARAVAKNNIAMPRAQNKRARWQPKPPPARATRLVHFLCAYLHQPFCLSTCVLSARERERALNAQPPCAPPSPTRVEFHALFLGLGFYVTYTFFFQTLAYMPLCRALLCTIIMRLLCLRREPRTQPASPRERVKNRVRRRWRRTRMHFWALGYKKKTH
jgi:hypothetical protein